MCTKQLLFCSLLAIRANKQVIRVPSSFISLTCLFSVVFPPHFLNLRKSGLEDVKVVENPAAPNTHVHACNYTHFIRRGSPVFHFVEFTKGRLPLRRVQMINDDKFVPRTEMTVPYHSMMLAMSHICLLAGLRKLKIAPSSFPLDFQLTPEC